MFYSNAGYGGAPVYAQRSDDKTSAWGTVIEKAWAKIIGNYLKINSGYIQNGFRALTGSPSFSYDLTSGAINVPTTFALLASADASNYIMGAGTGSGPTLNVCGLVNGHAYTILAAFNMTDAAGTVYSSLLIRNPWGYDNNYN